MSDVALTLLESARARTTVKKSVSFAALGFEGNMLRGYVWGGRKRAGEAVDWEARKGRMVVAFEMST